MSRPGQRWHGLDLIAYPRILHKMGVYQALLRPLLFSLDAEDAHHLALAGLQHGLGAGWRCQTVAAALRVSAPSLQQRLLDLDFANPIGLAGGMDKRAECVAPFAALGFGWIEVGTVTRLAQVGNPRPRAFRLRRDRGLINRMGLNNPGAEAMAQRLAALGPRGGPGRPTPLAVSIATSKAAPAGGEADDCRAAVAAIAAHADILIVNVSCPNQHGITALQAEAALRPLIEAVCDERRRCRPELPLFFKIGPDLGIATIDAAVDIAIACGAQGLVCTNTSTGRQGLATPPERVQRIGAGGLSGQPIRARSLAVLAQAARRAAGRLRLVGVGGIDSAEAAWERLRHGADLLQVYTGFVYEGPLLLRTINRGLQARLAKGGQRRLRDIIGSDL